MSEVLLTIACIVSMGMILTLILCLFQRLSDGHRETLYSIIKIAVEAAEQLYKGQIGMGVVKKERVLTFLCQKGYIKSLQDVTEEISNMIEAAVFNLKK